MDKIKKVKERVGVLLDVIMCITLAVIITIAITATNDPVKIPCVEHANLEEFDLELLKLKSDISELRGQIKKAEEKAENALNAVIFVQDKVLDENDIYRMNDGNVTVYEVGE
jgi:hypothetical protein